MGRQLLGNIFSSRKLDQCTILLILSKLAGLESRTINFVLAFQQADLDVSVYMELPIGMKNPGSVG